MDGTASEARNYLMTVFITVLVCLAVIPFVGNALPEPYRSYIPMLAGHDVVRDEFVRRHAMAEVPQPCVALFGDSRVAFNISGKIVDQFLLGECRSQNFGFPAFTLSKMRQLIAEQPVSQTLIVSISETMLDPSGRSDLKYRFLETLLNVRWVRYLYLGQQRFQYFFRSLPANSPRPTSWRWSTDEKRWIYPGMENRIFIKLPDYQQEGPRYASIYFENDSPIYEGELKSFLRFMSSRTKTPIVVIPPSEDVFQQASRTTFKDKQRAIWAAIQRSTDQAGIALVDCSIGCVAQSDFADPVHLNDGGVATYSSYIGRKIKAAGAALR